MSPNRNARRTRGTSHRSILNDAMSLQGKPLGFQLLEQRVLMSLAIGTPTNPTIYRLNDASQDFFEPLNSIAASSGKTAYILPAAYTPFDIDLPALQTDLSAAPMEFTAAANDPLILTLPRPDGTTERFNVVEAPIMEPGLAAQFPDIKTFRGQGIDDPYASIRFDYTPLGFHAQVRAPDDQSYYVDPYYVTDASGPYISYFKHDLTNTQPWEDMNDPDQVLSGITGASARTGAPSLSIGSQIRTYRLANAADGEYTVFFGGTVAQGQAAVVTAINRVDGIYESEWDVRLSLIANNSSIIYTNASTDPYTNNNGVTMLSQNQSNLDSVIGNANYDIGHVFSTGGGGVASVAVVTVTGQKARGVTGLPSAVGDPFYVDYVAHEMGHQFSPLHSFNSVTSSCGGGNRSASEAYEPGSGSAIMSYAGICGADNLQSNSDAWFAAVSIDDAFNFTNFGAASSVSPTATGNSPPTVNAGLDYTIPASTPFALNATGSDPNGDAITFDWQERDLGAATTLAAADNGASPLFRIWPPTSSATRLLPRLSTILAGQNNTIISGSNASERLYTVSRTSNWRVIARDNRTGGGGVATDDMVLTVVNTGAGFAVTSPNTAVAWTGNSTQTITWNVAGTTANGINAANVKISLSTDGGNTFSTVLLASTANDGTENITVPNINTTTARIKVEAVGNVFFDISNANFTINQTGGQSAQPAAPDLTDPSDTGVSIVDNVTRLNNSSGGTALTFSVTGTVSGALVKIFSDGTPIGSATASGTTTTVTTDGTTTLANGNHSITATQVESGKTESVPSGTLLINVDTVAPSMSAPSDYKYINAPQRIVYQFSENVQPPLALSNLSLVNTTTSTTITSGQMSLAYASNTATITFPGLANQILSDGNYTATLSGVTDTAGNALTTDVLNFFFLMGDANHDKTVDTTDFNILAAFFSQTSGVDFSKADFNYDGSVDTTDFNLLASNFSKTLPGPAARAGATSVLAAAAPGVPSAPRNLFDPRDSAFSDQPIEAIV